MSVLLATAQSEEPEPVETESRSWPLNIKNLGRDFCLVHALMAACPPEGIGTFRMRNILTAPTSVPLADFLVRDREKRVCYISKQLTYSRCFWDKTVE